MRRTNDSLGRRKLMTAAIAGGVVAGMLGLAYASVPLYRLFCQVTGFGGTPLIADGASETVGERVVKVRFNADTAAGMPWRFRPAQREISVRVGENALAFYRAENPTDAAVTGQASYNVTPAKAAPYFNKIDCFCFTEQRLDAGASADMPVSFFVDPAISEDPTLDDVTTITLSYVFFRLDEPEKAVKLSRAPEPGKGSAARE
jgi:cytochrome c oxidase assembly protein subunit 11